jgi:hypothetical protein
MKWIGLLTYAVISLSLQFVDMIMLWWKETLCYFFTSFRCRCLYGCTDRFNTCIATWGRFSFDSWWILKLFRSFNLRQTHVLCITSTVNLLQFCSLTIWDCVDFTLIRNSIMLILYICANNISIILSWMRVKSKHFTFHT